MKLLLLFTLSSALCYGQHYIVNETAGTIAVIYDKPAIDTPLADRNPNDISRPKNHPKPKVLSLEEKLLQYADECWNDSTIRSVHYKNICKHESISSVGIGFVNEPCNEFCEQGCSHKHHYYTKYIHRKPTFEGFIEWLRKQK